MPTQDPNLLPPGYSQGPFTRYLSGNLEMAEQPQQNERPSGYLGTAGKLAFFGGNILQGLQRGRMIGYQRREQQKFEQYQQAEARLKAVQADPDIPDEAKAQAGNLFGQVWSTQVKDQIKQAQQEGGKGAKDGPGHHILSILGNIANKIGGQTPQEHTLEGHKDKEGKGDLDRFNDFLASLHTGGAQFSNKARFQKGMDAFDQIRKQAAPDASYRDIFARGDALKILDQMRKADPDRAAAFEKDVIAAHPYLTPEQQNKQRAADWWKNAQARQQSGKGPVQVPGERQAATGSPRLADQPAAAPKQESPVPDFTQGLGHGPVPSPTSVQRNVAPPAMVGGIEIDPDEEVTFTTSVLPELSSRAPSRGTWKRTVTGPDGKPTTERVEAWEYANPQVMVNMQTGRILRPQDGWQPSTPGEHDAQPRAPRMTTIREQGPNGTMIERQVDLNEGPVTYKPYQTPVRAGRGSGAMTYSQKLAKEKYDEVQSARRGANKFLSDAMAYVAKNKGADLTTVLENNLQHIEEYYGSNPDIASHLDVVTPAIQKIIASEIRSGTAMDKRAEMRKYFDGEEKKAKQEMGKADDEASKFDAMKASADEAADQLRSLLGEQQAQPVREPSEDNPLGR